MIALSSMQQPPGKQRGWFWFAVLQMAIVVAGVGWARHAIDQHDTERQLPALRQAPRQVVPQRDVPAVVSDEQLQTVLTRLVPHESTTAQRINHIDHALRLWGAVVEHPGADTISGPDLQRLLIDHSRFTQRYGAQAMPLLMPAAAGIAVRVKEGDASSSHHDHTLACLAEVGTPLDKVVISATHESSVREMVQEALVSFRLNEREYEWTALVAALYLDGADRWTTAEGQCVTFDRLARRMMREELPEGVCSAHHRMHGLVMLLRVDDQTPILSTQVRTMVVEFLRGVTDVLVASQHPQGYWDLDWSGPESIAASATAGRPDALADRILATGHPMEWWALAPDEVLPPRSVVVAAGQWLARTVASLSDDQVQQYYTYLTHAGRALALWRGTEAGEVPLVRLWPAKRLDISLAFKDGSARSARSSSLLSAGQPGEAIAMKPIGWREKRQLVAPAEDSASRGANSENATNFGTPTAYGTAGLAPSAGAHSSDDDASVRYRGDLPEDKFCLFHSEEVA